MDSEHETTLAEINELIETSAKISVAYLAMRLTNLENTLGRERSEHARRIEQLESRLVTAGQEFNKLRKRVGELEKQVAATQLDTYHQRLSKLERNGH